MDNICIDCRKSADCKRKPRTDQWTVADCSWFEINPVITNADLIRQMSDEELARLFADDNCGYCHIHDFCFNGCPIDCEDMWLEWLKAPVEGKT